MRQLSRNSNTALPLQNGSMILALYISLLLPATFSYSQDQTQRPEDTALLDIDASGDVSAITDGLLILRSLFGFSDDSLTNDLVEDCENCDPTTVNNYVAQLSTLTLADLKSTGPQGETGPAGIDGVNGTNGENGADGVDGNDGQDGTDGADGNDGQDGIDGADGTDGQDGIDGNDGVDGNDGQDGIDGVAGSDGQDGTDGVNGSDGQDGIDGSAGNDGQDGTDGVDGNDGQDGTDGVDGSDGQDGTDGVDGSDGQDGTDGVDGSDGQDGTDGAAGSDGQDGIDGADGTDGQDGAPGPAGAATSSYSGDWSASSSYSKGQMVIHNHSPYWAMNSSSAIEPGSENLNCTNWNISSTLNWIGIGGVPNTDCTWEGGTDSNFRGADNISFESFGSPNSQQPMVEGSHSSASITLGQGATLTGLEVYVSVNNGHQDHSGSWVFTVFVDGAASSAICTLNGRQSDPREG